MAEYSSRSLHRAMLHTKGMHSTHPHIYPHWKTVTGNGLGVSCHTPSPSHCHTVPSINCHPQHSNCIPVPPLPREIPSTTPAPQHSANTPITHQLHWTCSQELRNGNSGGAIVNPSLRRVHRSAVQHSTTQHNYKKPDKILPSAAKYVGMCLRHRSPQPAPVGIRQQRAYRNGPMAGLPGTQLRTNGTNG